jgi:hypothetical protein
MKQEQTGISIRPETKKRLNALRYEQTWDDFMMKLERCYVERSPEFDQIEPINTAGKMILSGMKALELEKGDIFRINLYKGQKEMEREEMDDQAVAVVEGKHVLGIVVEGKVHVEIEYHLLG